MGYLRIAAITSLGTLEPESRSSDSAGVAGCRRIIGIDTGLPRWTPRFEELNVMDMSTSLMQVMHTIMMWLHQQGICPPMMMPM
ncbi:hypothetical protein [Nocardia australiensis]|uniref:hypothetical protein n=1 Tax=Nocardia australiensis TaxID=2887191 RepID=UPI001D14E91F|nr:hypothetical protein [Nocardia australiensis]